MATVREHPGDLLSEFNRSLQWDLVVHLSEREAATPVLNRLLTRLRERVGADEVAGMPDPDRLGHLARLARVHEFRLEELDRRLDRLVDAYRTAEIPVVLLKGAALRRTFGLSAADRPMSDVDLLVEEGRARRAWEVARELGWRRRPGLPPDEAYEEHHHLPPLVDDAGMGLGLEVHTGLFPHHSPFSFSAATVWERARPATGEPPALVPDPVHLLVHAALHLSWSHAMAFGAWKTFRDLRVLLESDSIDRERVVREVNECGAGTGVFWALELARRWADVDPGSGLIEDLRPRVPAPLRPVLARHFAFQLGVGPGTGSPVAIRRALWSVAMRPRASGHGPSRPWSGRSRWTWAGGQGGEGSGPLSRALRAGQYLLRVAAGSR